MSYGETNFIQDEATRLMEACNDQIATTIVNEINTLINLDSIIEADLANRKEYHKALESEKDEDIKAAMKEPTLSFVDITSKLEYAFKALLHAGYTFTHDIVKDGIVKIKFFKIVSEHTYKLNTTFTAGIEKIVD